MRHALLAVVAMLAAADAASAQRLARGSWWDRTPALWSHRYLIKTDLPAEQARAYGRHLDRMYDEYARRLATLPPRGPEKLNVYIFAEREEYVRTMRGRFGIDATGTGGMFFVSGAGDGLAFYTERLPLRRIHHVIQHEGFHQFAYSRFGNDLPRWVNEGLAEFFGEAMLVDGVFILGQSTPAVLNRVKDAIERREYIPFSQLLEMTDEQWAAWVRGGRADLAYHQAWSIVHFLVYADGGKYQAPFERYLRLVNNGMPSPRAFTEVFGPDREPFEKRWRDYALAARPSAFVTALERIEVLAEGALELSRAGRSETSLETLKDALRAAGFVHRVNHHGRTVDRDVRNDDAFEIPADQLTPTTPEFVVEKAKLFGLTLRQRKFEEATPTPGVIKTTGLRPRDLEVRWRRDRKSGELSYEIVVR
ncbi:MAG: DUF1570 domain-containing protein [Phycisphaerales bacterium]|nr:DUF1570 domain-containing protein [Phycisphaerales bacterium]NNM26420.1 DUF1570 domain-containing protein [Phycisphaerales bacterium]